MSNNNSQNVYRTTPARTGKMMLIMLGICLVGGAIFFGMWDYWISQPAPVVAMMAGDTGGSVVAVHTGDTITQDLSFIESSDFRTLAFNALPGDPDNNPTVRMNVGDKVVFNVDNAGKSFHSFGVTSNTEGVAGIIPGSEIGAATNPLKQAESGSSEFIAGEEGVFYYICTVPGHRAQGMVGQIVVGDVPVEEPVIPPVIEPIIEPETIVKSSEPTPVELDGVISIPAGSGVVGCDDSYECYTPYNAIVTVGDEVIWSNDDTAAHTVTSGTPSDGHDGNFDSSLFVANSEFSVTFDNAGDYPYYCAVHPWMVGNIIVN